MGERIRPSRSGLIAIELVIAIGVFALCAAVSMGLFVRSELLSRESSELTRAVSEARSAAECYKAAGGDLAETAAMLDTSVDDQGGLTVYYEKDWTPAAAEDYAFCLLLHGAEGSTETVREAELQVIDGEGEELLSWTVAAMEGMQ